MDQITINRINELNRQMASGNLSKSENRAAFLEINRLAGQMDVVNMYTPRTTQGNTYNAIANTVTTPSGKVYASSGGTPTTTAPVIKTATTTTPDINKTIQNFYSTPAIPTSAMTQAKSYTYAPNKLQEVIAPPKNALTEALKNVPTPTPTPPKPSFVNAVSRTMKDVIMMPVKVTDKFAKQAKKNITPIETTKQENITTISGLQNRGLTQTDINEATKTIQEGGTVELTTTTSTMPKLPVDTQIGKAIEYTSKSNLITPILSVTKALSETKPIVFLGDISKNVYTKAKEIPMETPGKKGTAETFITNVGKGAIESVVGFGALGVGLVTKPVATTSSMVVGLGEAPGKAYTAIKTSPIASAGYAVGMFALPIPKLGKTSAAIKTTEIERAISKGTIKTIKDVGITSEKTLSTIGLSPGLKTTAETILSKEGSVRLIKTQLEPYPSLIKSTPKVTGTFIESAKISDNLISGKGVGEITISLGKKTTTQSVIAKGAGTIDSGVAKTLTEVAVGKTNFFGKTTGTISTFVEKTTPVSQTILKAEETGFGRPISISKSETITGILKQEPIKGKIELLKGYQITEPGIAVTKGSEFTAISKTEGVSIIPDVNYLAKNAKPYSITKATQVSIPTAMKVSVDTIDKGLAIGTIEKKFLTVGRESTQFINPIEYDIIKKTKKSTTPFTFTSKEVPKISNIEDTSSPFKTKTITETIVIKQTSPSKSMFASTATRAGIADTALSLTPKAGYRYSVVGIPKFSEPTYISKTSTTMFTTPKPNFAEGTYGVGAQGPAISFTPSYIAPYIPSIVAYKPHQYTGTSTESVFDVSTNIRPKVSDLSIPKIIVEPRLKSNQIFTPRLINVPRIRPSDIQMPRIKNMQIYKQNQSPRLVTRFKQVPRLVTKYAVTTKPYYGTTFKFKPTTTLLPKIISKPATSTFKLNLPRKKKELYITEVRRRGVFKPIASSSTILGATKAGQHKVLSTLAASFRVRKADTGGFIKIAPNKAFRGTKKDMFTSIQRKGGKEGGLPGGRLTSTGEKKEIQWIKRMKK
jgi:hypothetical protein